MRVTSNPNFNLQEGCEATRRDLGHIRVGGDSGRGGEESADARGGQDQGEAPRGDGEGVEGRQARMVALGYRMGVLMYIGMA